MINSVSFGTMPVTEVMNLKKGDKVYTEPFVGKPNGVYYPEKELTVDSVHFYAKGAAVRQGHHLIDAPPEKATLCSIHTPDNRTKAEKDAGIIQGQSDFDIKDGQVMGINRESNSKKKWVFAGYSTLLIGVAVGLGALLKKHPNTNK